MASGKAPVEEVEIQSRRVKYTLTGQVFRTNGSRLIGRLQPDTKRLTHRTATMRSVMTAW